MERKRIALLIIMLISLLPGTKVLGQAAIGIKCGDIVEGEIVAGQAQTVTRLSRPREVNDYALNVAAGTRINLTVQPLGMTFNAAFVLVDSGDNDTVIVNSALDGEPEQLIDFPLGSSNQVLRIMGARPGSTFTDTEVYYFYYDNTISSYAGNFYGAYQILLGCTLRDGTVIEPGDIAAGISDTDNQDSGSIVDALTSLTTIPDFGFPGVQPRDFSEGIELPLFLGQAQTVPVASDVALYTYSAPAGEIATLKLVRVSGDISIGIAVINKDTREILFVGGMPSSNNLTVELTFPTDGTYAFGLFRLDTVEHTGTSGAVQIMLE